MVCEARSAGLKMPIHEHFFRRTILTRKVRQTDLVLACNHGSLVGLCIPDYKSLCAAVTIILYTTVVNTQTHTQHRQREIDNILTGLYEKLSELSKAKITMLK